MRYAHQEYAPLSASAVRRILQFDAGRGFGPDGTEANRNRFYLYLTQRGSDVQVRTVAVKAARRTAQPVAKEVALTSVDDPWINIRDLAYSGMGGYVVDWTPEGFGRHYYWDYKRRWESSPYGLRCMWKIWAPVVNPELLKRTSRFRWCAWSGPSQGHILDYLKIYSEHPEIEMLSKIGLGAYATKVMFVRKLKKDRAFRQFVSRHAAEIRDDCHLTVPVILKAYARNVSFNDAVREVNDRWAFRYLRLPTTINATRAKAYCARWKMQLGRYTNYLHNCEALGMDLDDTKVAFPRAFHARAVVVQDQVDEIRRRENAVRCAEMNTKLAAVAEEWIWLERKRGAFRIVLPRTVDDLIDEGKALRNCLGDGHYAARMARGELLVAFVRDAGRLNRAFVAVAYDVKKDIVTQCYGKDNSKPVAAVVDFVERAFASMSQTRTRRIAA